MNTRQIFVHDYGYGFRGHRDEYQLTAPIFETDKKRVPLKVSVNTPFSELKYNSQYGGKMSEAKRLAARKKRKK